MEMEDTLAISLKKSEVMQIIESLDHERERWVEIIHSTDDEDVNYDYQNDLTFMDELIHRFKTEAKKRFGDNIVELAHFPRGKSL